MLTTCYGFKIKDGFLRFPVKPRQYVYVKLNGHTLKVISRFEVRSITLTPASLSMNYSKETTEIEPEGYVGIDRNLDNVTVASTDGTVKTFDLSKATGIKSTYGLSRAGSGETTPEQERASCRSMERDSGTGYNQYSTTYPRG